MLETADIPAASSAGRPDEVTMTTYMKIAWEIRLAAPWTRGSLTVGTVARREARLLVVVYSDCSDISLVFLKVQLCNQGGVVTPLRTCRRQTAQRQALSYITWPKG